MNTNMITINRADALALAIKISTITMRLDTMNNKPNWNDIDYFEIAEDVLRDAMDSYKTTEFGRDTLYRAFHSHDRSFLEMIEYDFGTIKFTTDRNKLFLNVIDTLDKEYVSKTGGKDVVKNLARLIKARIDNIRH